MSKKQYLTAKEAALTLGITVSTLYAYVSRGLIRSEAAAGKTRARRYRLEDINALKKRKELRRNPAKAAETALHFGAPVLASNITLIQNGRLYYRGYDALELAAQHSFEEVAALIWSDSLTAAALFDAPANPQDVNLYQSLAPEITALSFIEQFQVILPLAASSDLAAYDVTAVPQTGVRILRLLATIATGRQWHTGTAPLLQAAWAAQTPQAEPLLNMALILCADHELNVSSFTARCVASAGSTPYGAVMAGLAALQGAKHGGYTERVTAFFREVGDETEVRQTIASRLRRGEGIPGFGHPLYPDGDPRGRLLMETATAVYPHQTTLARTIATAVKETISLHPTLDFGLVTVAQALKLPPGAALTLFALGRTVGWIGHAIEQYALNQIIRPRARYTGTPPIQDE